MGVRYRVNDLPTKGRGAFTPIPKPSPLSSSYGLVKVTAALSLLEVSTPAPTRVWAPPISADPKTQSSNVSPDCILPDQYIAFAKNMGPEADGGIGMTVRRMNPLPVPAISGVRTPQNAFRSSRKTGGRAAMPWPRAFQRWPTTSPSSGAESGNG